MLSANAAVTVTVVAISPSATLVSFTVRLITGRSSSASTTMAGTTFRPDEVPSMMIVSSPSLVLSLCSVSVLVNAALLRWPIWIGTNVGRLSE
ncbi:MAG: hypothetical protein OXN93_07620 [bacterium]|nr:hypothetical protein [bacterium]